MYGYRCHVCPAALDEGDAGPVQMLRHIEWYQELCATLRPGKGIVEGYNVRYVRHDGVFRQGESLDFIHAIGALLIDRDVPGNQICLVAVCCNAQGVDQTLAWPRIVHRAIRDTTANAVLNGAAQLLPVRPVVDGVRDVLVIAELFG